MGIKFAFFSDVIFDHAKLTVSLQDRCFMNIKSTKIWTCRETADIKNIGTGSDYEREVLDI